MRAQRQARSSSQPTRRAERDGRRAAGRVATYKEYSSGDDSDMDAIEAEDAWER
eukprot:SAG31_NODE_16940_length_689_cov_1.747458_1_plen_53_part_01